MELQRSLTWLLKLKYVRRRALLNAAETSEPARNMEHIYQCVAWMLSLASCNHVTYITHHNLYDVEAGNTLIKKGGVENSVWRRSSLYNAWHCKVQDENSISGIVPSLSLILLPMILSVLTNARQSGVKVAKKVQQGYNQAIGHTWTVPVIRFNTFYTF